MIPGAVETRGRPFVVATMSFANDKKLELMREFYTITATFRYREVVALSRALKMHPRTIDRWKYGETFPRWDIALDVIDWYKAGKPMTLVYQKDKYRSIMF